MLIVLAVICVYLLVLTARLKARADRQQELIDELRSRLDALADARPGAASAAPAAPKNPHTSPIFSPPTSITYSGSLAVQVSMLSTFTPPRRFATIYTSS